MRSLEELQLELESIQKQIDKTNKPLEDLKARFQELENKRYECLKGLQYYKAPLLDKYKYQQPIKTQYEINKIIERIDEEELEIKMKWKEVNENTSQLREQQLSSKKSILSQIEEGEREEDRKRKEKRKIELSKKPINLLRYISYWGNKPSPHKLVYLADKRETQIIEQICEANGLKVVRSSDLTDHFRRKYKSYRITKAYRNIYILPIDKPLKRNKIN